MSVRKFVGKTIFGSLTFVVPKARSRSLLRNCARESLSTCAPSSSRRGSTSSKPWQTPWGRAGSRTASTASTTGASRRTTTATRRGGSPSTRRPSRRARSLPWHRCSTRSRKRRPRGVRVGRRRTRRSSPLWRTSAESCMAVAARRVRVQRTGLR